VNVINEICKFDSFFRSRAKQITNNASYADDIVQEMYLRLINYDKTKLQEQFDRGVLKWGCIRIMSQIFKNHIRDNKKIVYTDDLTHVLGSVNDCSFERVQECLSKLYWFDRELLTLHLIDGQSIKEIIKNTGIPRNTIYTRINIAKQKLKNVI